MIKHLSLFVAFLIISVLGLSAQPKSINYQKDDFFMDVIYNPNASIFDFLNAGLNSKNTELKELDAYLNGKNSKSRCAELGISITETYKKVQACWRVFKEVENMDWRSYSQYMISYNRDNIFAPKGCPDPEFKHKLSIVPLKLEQY